MMSDIKQTAEVDIAYRILKESGEAIYFRELINQVLEIKARPIHSISYAISEIHTQINMDSRFVHLGKGMWGLADWSPQNSRRASGDDAATTAVPAAKRRERLLEEIQQDYVAAANETGEAE